MLRHSLLTPEAENTEGSDHREARRMQAAEWWHSRLLVFFFCVLYTVIRCMIYTSLPSQNVVGWRTNVFTTVPTCLQDKEKFVPKPVSAWHFYEWTGLPEFPMWQNKSGGCCIFIWRHTKPVTPLFGRKMCNSEGLYILLLLFFFKCKTWIQIPLRQNHLFPQKFGDCGDLAEGQWMLITRRDALVAPARLRRDFFLLLS